MWGGLTSSIQAAISEMRRVAAGGVQSAASGRETSSPGVKKSLEYMRQLASQPPEVVLTSM